MEALAEPHTAVEKSAQRLPHVAHVLHALLGGRRLSGGGRSCSAPNSARPAWGPRLAFSGSLASLGDLEKLTWLVALGSLPAPIAIPTPCSQPQDSFADLPISVPQAETRCLAFKLVFLQ